MMDAIDKLLQRTGFATELMEDETKLTSSRMQYDESLHEILVNLQKFLTDNKLGSCTFRTTTGENIDFNTYNSVDDGEGVFNLTKSSGPWFLTKEGFSDFLIAAKTINKTAPIQLYFSNVEFTTHADVYCKLLDSPSPKSSPVTFPDPKKFVKTIGAQAADFLPVDIGSWLTLTPTEIAIPDTWKQTATRKLLAAIASDFVIDGNQMLYEFKGDRRKTFIIQKEDKTITPDIFQVITETCTWIYQREGDVAIRLSFLQQQLSNNLPETITASNQPELPMIFSNSLNNAQLTFDFYLKGISKDLVKNLSDLNKSLLDNIYKIRQNTADLGTTLWKDFTTAVGVLILNFAVKKDSMLVAYFNYFAYALCIYVCISFTITSLNGFWSYYAIRTSMNESRGKLYSYIADDEFIKICTTPIKNAFIKFRSIFFVVLTAYLIVILFLLNQIPVIHTYLLKEAKVIQQVTNTKPAADSTSVIK